MTFVTAIHPVPSVPDRRSVAGFVYQDEAFVLRTRKLSESDRVATLLTREHGLIRAVAKGVRHTSSSFGARIEPFGFIDVQIRQGRSLELILQAETVRPYGEAIVADYSRYTVANALVEATEILTASAPVAGAQQFILLADALRALAERSRTPGLILDAYLLRSLALAGWRPQVAECAICGRRPEAGRAGFSIARGGVICEDCRLDGARGSIRDDAAREDSAPDGIARDATILADTSRGGITPGSGRPGHQPPEGPISEGERILLQALLTGDHAVSQGSSLPDRRLVSRIVAAYFEWNLDRRLKSLQHVERM